MAEIKNVEEVPLAKGPILHVIVVGFHHKKGCQVEYSFPPLVDGARYDSNECPPGWQYLPTLALPDGSHNFEEDTVYFHLPSLKNPRQTIFGVSCFRQIPVEKLTNRTSDITRGTVQKSVCVLSTLPLYGHIQVKMALITHAYFEEGDFSKVSLLQDTFTNLNSCLSSDMLDSSQAFVGLSLREFILQFKHKALLLFKLLLLERRVLFFRSPVQQLCATILSLLSLHPGMIERGGLNQAACVKTSRPMSPMPCYDAQLEEKSPVTSPVNESGEVRLPDSSSQSSITMGVRESSVIECSDASPEDMFRTSAIIARISAEKCGLPLAIFSKGYLCHPYLSLPYMDMLSDVNVRGYIIGATNFLFKQKRQLADVLIEIEDARVEACDPELRKQLHLTTEDLRFADHIVRHVSEEKHDVFLDGVGWEGGDEWIRAQFRVYQLCLMRTAMLEDESRELEPFNLSFIGAWKNTHNFKMWASVQHEAILDIPVGHPYSGQLSVADMKLRFSHTMQNTESGRKLNQAMATTGRAVAHTSKAVGGAISQAKGAFSSWWTTLTTAQNLDTSFYCEPTEEFSTDDTEKDGKQNQPDESDKSSEAVNTQNLINIKNVASKTPLSLNGSLINETIEEPQMIVEVKMQKNSTTQINKCGDRSIVEEQRTNLR